MRLFLYLILIIMTASPYVHANFRAEPYIGFWSGTLQQKGGDEIATKGLLYGARLGYGNMIKAGLDFMMGSSSGNQGGSTGEYKNSSIGPYIGFNLTSKFQFYYSYFIKSSAEIQPDKNAEKFSGSGMRFGFGGTGWGGLNFLSINLELISRTYDEYNGAALSAEIKEKAVAVSLSIPFPGGGSVSVSSDSGASL